MAMLKFKKGLWAKLPETKVEGTIYVTTDEKAMYVDISDSERIRLGDIIRVNTFNELQPPFSNEAFYYVESSNALLKRVAVVGENDVVTYEWKQINGTQELQSALTALTGRVSTLEGTVGSATSGLVKDVNDLKTTVGDATEGLVKDVADNAKDIEALQAALGLGEGSETDGTLAGSVAQLRTDLTTLETEVHGENGEGGMKATLADHQGRIAALEGKDVALKSDVTAAKSAILGQTDGADFNGTVKGAYEAAAAAQTQADKGVSDAAAAKAVADTNKENLSALTGRVTALDQAGTGRVAVLEGKVDTLEKAGYATVDQVNTAKGEVLGTEGDAAGAATVHGALKSAAAAKSAADAADGKAAAAQGTIDAWKEAHKDDYTNTKIDELVADAKKAGTDAQADFDAYETAHASDYTNKQIDDKVKAVQDKVDEHTGTLTTLTSGGVGSVAEAKAAADAAQEDATQALIDAAAAKTQADKGVEDAAAAKSAADAAQDTADANAGEIAALKGVVGTAKKGTGDGTEGNDAATGLYKLIEDSDKAIKAELESTIEKEINAANAMDYQKGIASQTELDNIVTPKAGDTYVVTAQFGNYYPGDLLIATGDEDETTGTISTDNLSWTHVKTGYDASLEQKLETVGDKVQLSSIAGANNGQISFVSDGSAVTVSVAPVSDTDNNPVVTIGMAWEDFE